MKRFVVSAFVIFCSVACFASAYGDGWFVEEFWSGEYPNGFSVLKEGVIVSGRAGMDKALPADVACALPYKASFSPWNDERNKLNQVSYFQAAEIVPLVAAKDISLSVMPEFDVNSDSVTLEIKKGDVVEYIIYYAEGSFRLRVNGQYYSASWELFDDGNLEEASQELFDNHKYDEWLTLTCENGTQAWLLMSDLNLDDNEETFSGPNLIEYGSVKDLP